MSKMKKIILIILLVMMTIIAGMSTEVSAKSKKTRKIEYKKTMEISLNELENSDNLYCVAHSKHLTRHRKYTYKAIAYVDITGEHSEGKTAKGKDKTADCRENAIMSAILGGAIKEQGYGEYGDYADTQKALYKYWNKWVKAVGKKYGFQTDSSNNNISGASKFINKAKKLSKTTNYKVRIYLLQTKEGYNPQELILVEVKKPETPETPTPDEPTPEEPTPEPTVETGYINISGYVWEDVANSKSNTVNNKYDVGEQDQTGGNDIKLEGIKVHWKASDGSEIASTTTGKDGSYKMQTEIDLNNHPYDIEHKEKYDIVNNSYIEFEYNGYKYTTVAYNGNLSNSDTSKGKENETSRTTLDNKFDKVENRAVYDEGQAIISGLPNNQISDANYCSEFAVSASTQNIIRNLMKTAESNEGWTETKEFCTKHSGSECKTVEQKVYVWNIKNVNLGLVRREQPDLAITSDIEKVRVVMKNQEYTYIYGNRGIKDNEELFDYKVKFGNKYAETYSRPINPSDIAYVNYNNSDDLKVYVTYNIILKNQSNTLSATVNSIANYYDSNYTIYTGQGTATSAGWQYSGQTNNGYKVAYNNSQSGIRLQPGAKSDIIKIEFEVNQDRIKGLLNEDATLYNVSEIFSFTTYYGENTICAERESASAKGRTGKQYAGIDVDSTPGNAVPGNVDTYEDDTDKAPSFLLLKDPNYKTISGIVYEDTQTKESKNNNERLGNGQRDKDEKGVENVKVELLQANTGETAYLYYKESSAETGTNRKPAITYTDANGNYSFGDGETCGVIEDSYIIKYTYGNAEETQTKINGNIINARNYKSTIITDANVKNEMQGNHSDKWYLSMNENVDTSIAVDDLKERLAIGTLKYATYENGVNMSAYSKEINIKIEYTQEQSAKVDNNGGEFKKDWATFDFGIIERSREDLVINKNISKIKVTLANGQVLLEGNPRTDDLDYVKAIGLKEAKTDANNREIAEFSPLDKLLTIEIDSELIQGAKLEIWYSITVTNNSEIDYEYEKDYTDIIRKEDGATSGINYITNNSQANYYYYGNKEGLTKIERSAEIVADYINPKLECNVGIDFNQTENIGNVNNIEWIRKDKEGKAISAEYLKELGYISYKTDEEQDDKTYETINNREMQVIITNAFAELGAGDSKTSVIYASTTLSNEEDGNNIFDNHVEIIAINGKTGRTIKSVEDKTREQVAKTYQPGNYIPTLGSEHQQDDDRVRVAVTPPTGINIYTTIYIITAVVGFIAIAVVAVYIKKKGLKKETK